MDGAPAVRGNSPLPTLAVTTGEPAGIGPDICAMLAMREVEGDVRGAAESVAGESGAAESVAGDPMGADPAASDSAARLIFLGDPDVLAERVRDLDLPVAVETLDEPAAAFPHRPGVMQVAAVAAARPVRAGRLDPGNARYVLGQLERGVQLCTELDRCALVTAPVQKSTINAAGVAFTGHTEWLAARTGAGCPVMMLASPNLRVALVTTHLPLSGVSSAITAERLQATIIVLHADLRARFGIDSPRIMVLGLNPHAGEDGVLGR
ncbi:MAG: 4-hydroxythreonine-4-phosphate dehydrogenase PdxA, partial [Rhodospirillaceae bacterium]|nr:4-hydroxythreonine-4-phosphate dehydrogenase PdxA [Rhodospirillaceae bacterium]